MTEFIHMMPRKILRYDVEPEDELPGFTIYEHLRSCYKKGNDEIPASTSTFKYKIYIPLIYAISSCLILNFTSGDHFMMCSNHFIVRTTQRKKLTKLQDDVKIIGGSELLCCYITLDDDLYCVEPYHEPEDFDYTFISHNVKFACVESNAKCHDGYGYMGQTIHFVTFDNQQLSYTSDEIILPSNYNMGKKSLLTKTRFKSKDIIDVIGNDIVLHK